MLLDFVPFIAAREPGNFRERAIGAIVALFRKKFDLIVGSDARQFPLADARLSRAARFADSLLAHGLIKRFQRNELFPDEPFFYSWAAICNVDTDHQVAGASFESDDKALMAALAEGLERTIWLTETDYFEAPRIATVSEIAQHGRAILPESWVGFSAEQRTHTPERMLAHDARYQWIHGMSLVDGKKIFVPAQVVSGLRDIRQRDGAKEPLIRPPVTNGLATWPTRAGAQIAGMLELIEREAYMIMWLNQLTLPRVALASLAERDPSLAPLLKKLARYRLRPHVIQLLTDAPTHAVCVVLEDESGVAPRFAVGLKAHQSLSYAIQKATTEALRARRGYRLYAKNGGVWDDATRVVDIGHRDRIYFYGAHPEHLEFMVRGEVCNVDTASWEHDDEKSYREQLIAWCVKEKLACISVPLTTSKKNQTPLHIEMVLMPALQPTYLQESARTFGGDRWRTIPEKFGYRALPTPFTARPHPFS